MRKAWLFLSCALLALTSAAPTRAEENRYYTNEELGFYLERPEAWRFSQELSEELRARFTASGELPPVTKKKKPKLTLLAFAVRDPDLITPSFPTLRVELVDERALRKLGALEVARRWAEARGQAGAKPALRKVNGRTGSFLEVEHQEKGSPLRTRAWFFAFDARWLRVTIHAAPDAWAQVEAEADATIKSLHFSEIEEAPAARASSKDEILQGLSF